MSFGLGGPKERATCSPLSRPATAYGALSPSSDGPKHRSRIKKGAGPVKWALGCLGL